MDENRPISVGDKIWSVVANKFSSNAFTSSDIQEMFEAEYVEPIQLSIISTYLSRYSEKGKLSRIKKGKEWVYRMGNSLPTKTLFRRDHTFDGGELSHNIAKSTEVN
jgi:predicted transcriptional regulator